MIFIAPVAAMIAVLFSGAPLLASYTQIFMPALGGFIVNFFPVFLVGAIFGRLMSVSGYAEDLARWISRALGAQRAILATSIASALLTYGGVSAWVVVFAMFPIAQALFKEAGIPRRLMPAAIALGFFSFAMAALPGSPQIHNAIPTRYFETTTFAAPLLGILGAVVTYAFGLAWLGWRQRKLMDAGESYGPEQNPGAAVAASTSPGPGDDTGAGPSSSPAGGVGLLERTRTGTATSAGATTKGMVALLPILVVVSMNFLFVYVLADILNFDYLAEERFGATTLSSVIGVWSVTVALATAVIVIFLMQPRRFRDYIDGISEGAKTAVLPAFTTASEVGYGGVIASLAVFAVIREGIFEVSDNALVVSAVSTATIAAITGSSSGGLSIALESFGSDLARMAAEQGISADLMHRVTAMASVSFDSLPHNGAVITLLLVCGLTHRQSYKDIGMVTVIAPSWASSW